jgi:hypothetical protein
MKSIALSIGVLLLLNCTCFAIEIKNSKATLEGKTVQITYDLIGKPGERLSRVKVALMVDGERYLPGAVNLTGDFGANIPVGKGRKIVWDLLKDMPAGYDGEITWELDADPEASNDPFNLMGARNKTKPPVVSETTVADPKSRLIWMRSPVSAKNVRCAEDAVSVVSKLNQSSYLGANDWRLPKKDELESLFKMIELYGYTSRQSAVTYLEKVGFDIGGETRFWSVDKSGIEYTGKEVYVTRTKDYASDSSVRRTASASHSGPSHISNRSTKAATTNISGAMTSSSSVSVKTPTEDSGLYDLVVDTKNGYFYKHNGTDPAKILAVRGNGASEIYAVSAPVKISIAP